MTVAADGPSKTQLDKFKDAARELECDDDEDRFKGQLKKLVKHKPVEKSKPGTAVDGN